MFLIVFIQKKNYVKLIQGHGIFITFFLFVNIKYYIRIQSKLILYFLELGNFSTILSMYRYIHLKMALNNVKKYIKSHPF